MSCRPLSRILLAIVALSPLGGACGEHAASPEASVSSLSADGQAQQVRLGAVQVQIPAAQLKLISRQAASMDLMLSGPDGKPLAAAEVVAIEPWMPMHAHGSKDLARAYRPVGAQPGIWRVENVVPSMSGPWELRLTVEHAGSKVRLDVPFVVAGDGSGH